MSSRYEGNSNSNKFIGSDDRESYEAYGYGGNDTLVGNAENDSLYGGAGNDSIKGEDGDDLIEGGTGNDKLYGGNGADTFVYTLGDGNDTIFDYELEDKIRFMSGTPTFKKSGSDVIITVGTGKITVKNAAEKVITYIDQDNNEFTYPKVVSIKGTTVTLLDGYAKTDFDLGDYDDVLQTVNASAVTHDLSITGNAKANRIIGSEENDYINGGAGKDTILGGDGNDTILGGTGNDNFTGGAGADAFLYASGDGNDVITDYTEEDVIHITSGKVSAIKKSDDDVIFTVGKGQITIKDGAERVITYIDEDGEHTYPAKTMRFNKTTSATSVTLLSAYVSEQFNVTANAQVGDHVGSLKTINASAVDHDIEITGNDKANRIIGSATDDNTIIGGKGNDTLTGGSNEDVFVFNAADGKDVVTNYEEHDVIQFTSGTINEESQISENGNDVIFTINKSNTVTIKNAKGKYITYIDADGEHTYNGSVTVEYNSKGTAATLLSNYSDSVFSAAESKYPTSLKSINASAVEHELSITGNGLANKIIGTEEDDYIAGGAGKDTILGGDGNDTIIGGTGNDSLTGGDGADAFLYAKGDGNDVITDYTDDDTIYITGAVATAADSGKNVIFTVGSGKITLIGAADKAIRYFDSEGEEKFVHGEPYTVKGKTVTLNEIYSKSSFDVADVSDKITTIDASAVTHDLSITGNANANRIIGSEEDDYIDGGAGKDTLLGGDGNDTLLGGTGNDSLNGGDGADVFIYRSGDGNDVITDYTEEDVIQFTSGTASAKTSGNDVIFTSGSGKITVKGGKEHVITYVDADGTKIYPAKTVSLNAAGTVATLLKNYRATTFDVTTNAYVADYSDILKTINGAAVTHDIEIIGNKLANSISGGAYDDTLTGGKGNDTLFGGEGQDVFVYAGGDGKDVISDYTEGEDVINITSGTIKSIKNSGSNVVFTVDSGTITVKNGKGKSITYVDPDGVERNYPTPYVISDEKVTLTDKYYASTFNVNDYDEMSSIRQIDASAVTGDLKITGNKLANLIVGSAGDNTIIGGKGNDTLYGGDGGSRVYVYNNGDGNDLIVGFNADDTLRVESGVLSGDVRVNGSTVIFTVGKGKISLQGAANTPINVWYDDETRTDIYTDALIMDESDVFGAENSLTTIVRDGTTSPYSVTRSGDTLVFEMENSSIPAVSYSDKK